MAQFLLQNSFRFAVFTLNYVSPSILADVILHPFDFATVLLQIGYDPEGIKDETASLASVIVQYALFTLYIPYILTSMQGLQLMGLPHPSMFYYVGYIYHRDGFIGCYRGLTSKIFERLIVNHVNETVKQVINQGQSHRNNPSRFTRDQTDDDLFLRSLINHMCCHFFAVLASHPFHVITVTGFADFMRNRSSTTSQLATTIYDKDGLYGFFIGLAPRLVGELLALTFSITYTSMINKQTRLRRIQENRNPSFGNDAPRLTAFQQNTSRPDEPGRGVEERIPSATPTQRFRSFFIAVFGWIIRNGNGGQSNSRTDRGFPTSWRIRSILSAVSLTSKSFYLMMIRDYVSKKISYPFFLVCHCMIILDTGWDKLPFIPYVEPMIKFVHALLPRRKRDQTPNL